MNRVTFFRSNATMPSAPTTNRSTGANPRVCGNAGSRTPMARCEPPGSANESQYLRLLSGQVQIVCPLLQLTVLGAAPKFPAATASVPSQEKANTVPSSFASAAHAGPVNSGLARAVCERDVSAVLRSRDPAPATTGPQLPASGQLDHPDLDYPHAAWGSLIDDGTVAGRAARGHHRAAPLEVGGRKHTDLCDVCLGLPNGTRLQHSGPAHIPRAGSHHIAEMHAVVSPEDTLVLRVISRDDLAGAVTNVTHRGVQRTLRVAHATVGDPVAYTTVDLAIPRRAVELVEVHRVVVQDHWRVIGHVERSAQRGRR